MSSDEEPLTLIVTASASPLHPSTAVLQQTLLSLRHLGLPRGYGPPVLLAHDAPRARDAARYAEYLRRVKGLLPAAAQCTGLTLRLLVRPTVGRLAGNLAFALAHVSTPFMLKVEHDHPFTRSVDVLSVVRDMVADRRLKCVRFNRRENRCLRCDSGEFGRVRVSQAYTRQLARKLWGAHAPRRGTLLRYNYTRTSCFSDMNHLAVTSFYRDEVMPVVLRAPWRPPEAVMQDECWIARNHARYGTYIWDGPDALAAIVHIDAAMRAGVGELLPHVRAWLRGVHARARNGTADPPFRCAPALDLRPRRKYGVLSRSSDRF